MPRLPMISGSQAVKAFQRAGWHVDRQRGSHVVLLKAGHIASLSVPQHKELAPGTLRSLLRNAAMTAEELLQAAMKLWHYTVVLAAILLQPARATAAIDDAKAAAAGIRKAAGAAADALYRSARRGNRPIAGCLRPGLSTVVPILQA